LNTAGTNEPIIMDCPAKSNVSDCRYRIQKDGAAFVVCGL
jgi:hypothetical protein